MKKQLQPTLTLNESHLTELGWATPFEAISLERPELWNLPARLLASLKRRHRIIIFELGDESRLVKCTPRVIYILHLSSDVKVPERQPCGACGTGSHLSGATYCAGCSLRHSEHFHVDCIGCAGEFLTGVTDHKQAPRHYTGSTPMWRLTDRIKEHRTGQGAKFTSAAIRQGIKLHLAAILPAPKGRYSEADFKRMKNAPRYCPLCRQHER